MHVLRIRGRSHCSSLIDGKWGRFLKSAKDTI